MQRCRCLLLRGIISIATVAFILINGRGLVFNNAFITGKTKQMLDTNDVSLLFDNRKSDDLASKVRLLCMVMIGPELNLTDSIQKTWGPRCDKTLFFTSLLNHSRTGNLTHLATASLVYIAVTNDSFPETVLAVKAYKYVCETFLDEFDWFLKVEDEVYVVVENLKLLLLNKDPDEAVCLGNHRKFRTPQGHLGPPPGYVMSRRALSLLVNQGAKMNDMCRFQSENEAIDISICLHKSGVRILSSLDAHDKHTFHPRSPGFYMSYDMSRIQKKFVDPMNNGFECCSHMSVTFHGMKPEYMLLLDILLYHIRVFGRDTIHNDVTTMFPPPAERQSSS